MRPRVVSLFSGIGGLDLGIERAIGGRTVLQCESDPFCLSILARHWPDVPRFEDVEQLQPEDLPPYEVLAAGFPCQDVSQANHAGRGIDGARSGLWWEAHRLIRATRPRGIVLENVDRLYRRGLDVVCAELCAIGYRVEYARVSAEAAGAPHRRLRIFVVAALADSDGWRPEGQRIEEHGDQQGERGNEPHGRCAGGRRVGERGDGARHAEPRVGGATAGVPSGLDGPGPGGEWPAGRGEPQRPWEGPRALKVPNQRNRLRALGNACMPQQAYIAGCRLREIMGAEHENAGGQLGFSWCNRV